MNTLYREGRRLFGNLCPVNFPYILVGHLRQSLSADGGLNVNADQTFPVELSSTADRICKLIEPLIKERTNAHLAGRYANVVPVLESFHECCLCF